MSMPQFPDKPSTTLEGSVTQIITSIAMEELALSHIINAEGEKIQYVLGSLSGAPRKTTPHPIKELIKINESVQDMLSTVAMNQMLLFGKLSAAMHLLRKNNCAEEEEEKSEIPVHQ
jgi:hypothetical protein